MDKTYRAICHQKSETLHFLIYVKPVETLIMLNRETLFEFSETLSCIGYVLIHIFDIRSMLSMLYFFPLQKFGN